MPSNMTPETLGLYYTTCAIWRLRLTPGSQSCIVSSDISSLPTIPLASTYITLSSPPPTTSTCLFICTLFFLIFTIVMCVFFYFPITNDNYNFFHDPLALFSSLHIDHFTSLYFSICSLCKFKILKHLKCFRALK